MRFITVAFGMCAFITSACAQSVQLLNTANGALDDRPQADFVEGDTFSFSIARATANAAVTVSTTMNGIPNPNNPAFMGTTNSSGAFSINGTVTPGCCVGHQTQQWYVNGVAAGPLLDFETIYKPASLTVLSASVAALPPICTNNNLTYGVWADVKYQIKDAGGHNVTTLTGIPMVPSEFVTEYNPDGTVLQTKSNDVGPVTGYPTSSQYAADDGTFHDVPWGVCANYAYANYHVQNQIIYIDIGNNSPQVRTNDTYATSSSPNHGSVTNSGDISVSR